MEDLTDKQVLVISDTHLRHRNIISYTGRPVHCDRMMIDAMKQQRRVADHIIHVGDFCCWYGVSQSEAESLFEETFGDIEVTLIRGNHDRKGPAPLLPWTRMIEEADQPYLVQYNGMKISFKHYPYEETFPQVRIAVHGHIHEQGQRLSWQGNSILVVNACVEHFDYKPFWLHDIVREWPLRLEHERKRVNARRRRR